MNSDLEKNVGERGKNGALWIGRWWPHGMSALPSHLLITYPKLPSL